jgi:hypothetical protein
MEINKIHQRYYVEVENTLLFFLANRQKNYNFAKSACL